MFLASCAINPVTGEREFMVVSESEEIAIGQEAVPSLSWGFGGRYRDPWLESYLEGIVRRIWQNSERPHLPMKFVIQNTSIPNAFALPGYVAITRGLLCELENEAQFVAVMGHEVGHVMARHTAQRISIGTIQQLGLVLGGAALEGRKGGNEILTLGAIGSSLILLKYDRGQEIQADRLGVRYTARLGYEPKEALNAHERLEVAVDNYLRRAGKTRKEDTFLDELLSTHPRTEIRRHEIESMINELPPYQIQQDGRFGERFQTAIAKIKEVNRAYFIYDETERLYGKGKFREAEERLHAAISMNSEQAPFYNLMGMVRLRQKDYHDAEKLFRNALSIDNEYQPSYYGLGLVEYMRGNYRRAIDEFRMSLNLYPSHPGSLLGIGRSYFSIKEWRRAIPHLRNFAEVVPKHPEVHGLLGICYENTGDLRLAVREYEFQVRIAPNTDLGRHAQGRLFVLKPLVK